MSEEITITEEVGSIKISDEVISTVAGIAVSEVKGIAGMFGGFAGGIAEILGAKKSPSKGVKVVTTGNNVIIDLYIIVEYGCRIPDIAWEAQETVKTAVETMTGLFVEKVNIHIEGVNIEKEKKDDTIPVTAEIVDDVEIAELADEE